MKKRFFAFNTVWDFVAGVSGGMSISSWRAYAQEVLTGRTCIGGMFTGEGSRKVYSQWKIRSLCRKRMGLCTLRHGAQNSMDAILTCHLVLSTEWLSWVTIRVNDNVLAQAPFSRE